MNIHKKYSVFKFCDFKTESCKLTPYVFEHVSSISNTPEVICSENVYLITFPFSFLQFVPSGLDLVIPERILGNSHLNPRYSK